MRKSHEAKLNDTVYIPTFFMLKIS